MPDARRPLHCISLVRETLLLKSPIPWGRGGAGISLACVLLSILTAFVSCAGPVNDDASGSVHIAAAASLEYVLPEIADVFEAREGIETVVTFASSGMIASQVRSGAPIDLFCSADASWIDRLRQAGAIDEETVQIYAKGQLVLAFAPDVDSIEGNLDQLKASRFDRIGVSNPRLSPYGSAVEVGLRRLGAWEALNPKAVLGENVGQVLVYVKGGNVDAAFVPLPLAAQAGLEYELLDEGVFPPVEHVLAVPLSAANPKAGERFAQFLLSQEARESFARHHFGLP